MLTVSIFQCQRTLSSNVNKLSFDVNRLYLLMLTNSLSMLTVSIFQCQRTLSSNVNQLSFNVNRLYLLILTNSLSMLTDSFSKSNLPYTLIAHSFALSLSCLAFRKRQTHLASKLECHSTQMRYICAWGKQLFAILST